MTTLSDTHLLVLSAGAARDDRLVTKTRRLPGASLQRVCEALAKRGLPVLAELEARDTGVLTIETEEGWHGLAITAAGLEAIGVEEEVDDRPRDERLGVDLALIEGPEYPAPEPEAAIAATVTHSSPVAVEASAATTRGGGQSLKPPQRPSAARGVGGLRMAAEAVLTAWEGGSDLAPVMVTLQAALAPASKAPRTPRTGTKTEAVLMLLRREDRASIAQIIEATGWAPHTVRGYLAGLKKLGVSVKVLERVRQVGPNKQGAKVSYSIYRIAG
ncbi:DUF3489 domain-containing protein [Elioraea rosea]|uniref:DUF3489 domain-containing protein n=1 Tax=Elioraea rosea TaxID=2492390 RepID=UPI001951696A|nr:DUF3489 domain-containing protein [Elioraea rosea]